MFPGGRARISALKLAHKGVSREKKLQLLTAKPPKGRVAIFLLFTSYNRLQSVIPNRSMHLCHCRGGVHDRRCHLGEDARVRTRARMVTLPHGGGFVAPPPPVGRGNEPLAETRRRRTPESFRQCALLGSGGTVGACQGTVTKGRTASLTSR